MSHCVAAGSRIFNLISWAWCAKTLPWHFVFSRGAPTCPDAGRRKRCHWRGWWLLGTPLANLEFCDSGVWSRHLAGAGAGTSSSSFAHVLAGLTHQSSRMESTMSSLASPISSSDEPPVENTLSSTSEAFFPSSSPAPVTATSATTPWPEVGPASR